MKTPLLSKKSVRLCIWTCLAVVLAAGIFFASSAFGLYDLLLQKDNPIEQYPKIRQLAFIGSETAFRYLAVTVDSVPYTEGMAPDVYDETYADDEIAMKFEAPEEEAASEDAEEEAAMVEAPPQAEEDMADGAPAEEAPEEAQRDLEQAESVDEEAAAQWDQEQAESVDEEAAAPPEEDMIDEAEVKEEAAAPAEAAEDTPTPRAAVTSPYTLTELSYEYLTSVASEYKPIYFEIYVLPLTSDHDRRGYYPSSRLEYPPPAEAHMVYASEGDFTIPGDTLGFTAFCNTRYLINDVGERSPGEFQSGAVSVDTTRFDHQLLFYYTAKTGDTGRQAAAVDTAVNEYQSFLRLTPEYWKVGLVAAFLLVLALLCVIVLYYYYSTYAMPQKSTLHLDLWTLLWVLWVLIATNLGLGYYWSNLYTTYGFVFRNLMWTFVAFSILYLFLLLVAGYIRQLREKVLVQNLFLRKAYVAVTDRAGEMFRTVKVWPQNFFKANLKSFILVFALLLLIALLPFRFAWIVLLVVGYLLLELFFGLGRIIQQARSGELASEPEKRRFFSFLSPLIEALKDKEKASQRLMEDKLKSERMRTELITNVSHDIKTPLTSIISYSDLLEQHFGEAGCDDPTARQYLDTIQRQAARLKRLSVDLVDSSKLHSGAVQLELYPLSVKEVVPQALAEYESAFKERQLELHVDYHTDRRVLANGPALWRVLNNLLLNVQRHSRPRTRVYVDVREADDKVYIRLRNISKQALNLPTEDLLERFIRGERSRNEEGSGLGLSIADSLMTLMQGKLRLDVVADLFTAELELKAIPEAPGTADQKDGDGTSDEGFDLQPKRLQ